MAATEPPITRSELKSELQEELRHYATKADLANMKAGLVTWLVSIFAAFVTIAVSLTAVLLNVLG